MRQFADFNRFIYEPIANYKGEIYNLPFNMNTYSRLWGVTTPAEAQAIIHRQISDAGIREPKNLEDQAIALVGRDIYDKLIKGYTQKQWGRTPRDLPAFIIRRLPVRFTYNNNYFDDPYQGIPIGGYTPIIEKLLSKVEVRLSTDFFKDRGALMASADKVVFTGMIDAYYDYRFGHLQYRSLRFETETLAEENHQGVAVMNYTDEETPYTRVIEHKHFEFGMQPKTVLTREYPAPWNEGDEPFYPINDAANQALLGKYRALAAEEKGKVLFGGRLGEYRYLNMDEVITLALEAATGQQR